MFNPIKPIAAFVACAFFSSASLAQSGGSIGEKAALNLTLCVVAFKDYVKSTPQAAREQANLDTAKSILNTYAKPELSATVYLSHIDKYQAQVEKDPSKVNSVAQSCNRYVETFLE